MKWLVLGFLLLNSAWAENSKIIPVFIEATNLYLESNQTSDECLYLRPDIRAALKVLEDHNIDPEILEKRVPKERISYPLRADDKYDQWIKRPAKRPVEVPEMAMQAFKMKVIEESDGWFKDDIYVYFFVTDGVIPTGKVTSIYKGVGQGQSFFFNEIDRAIFPLIGVPAKRPENHLIIDYGIMESDGDDIKEMQKISSIIIDLAIAVYASRDPQNAQVIINLRKEIKALTELLLSLNNDDRQATGTIAYKAEELTDILSRDSYVEIKRTHKGTHPVKTWEYELYFRLLRK
ncbi:hypothetical protein [Peredibacter starrii]|uniref:Uncharacterized protein n=1 Tax=Peredibacter starrii TaxID=28202 RepID=A0AAX4HRL7_9BACT|nr:hypothetical protein [Peredibacter starrii]WPU66028.1 hypothetical protein SOO65_04650 [Peredibacter starrii]